MQLEKEKFKQESQLLLLNKRYRNSILRRWGTFKGTICSDLTKDYFLLGLPNC